MSMTSTIFEHASAPQNRRTMERPSTIGRANLGGRPPEVVIYLKLEGNRVVDASFEAHGCGYTIACCSALTELIKNKTTQECLSLQATEICAEIGELPRERQFCATLAVEALQAALVEGTTPTAA